MDDEIPVIKERLTKVEDSVRLLQQAFPENDYDGHRRAHKALIEDVEARKRLAQAVREKSISALVWAAIVGILTLLWQGLKIKLGGLL